MVDPSQFDNMVSWAFVSTPTRVFGNDYSQFPNLRQVVATFIYAVIGYAGYLMFGRNVSDEVSLMLRIWMTNGSVDDTLDQQRPYEYSWL
jgi:hypothetical protein